MSAPANRCWLLLALLLAGLCPPLRGQQAWDERELSLRVISVMPGGGAWVDRGARDGVAPGDRVRLVPREGLPHEGHVVAVEANRARVELLERDVRPQPGMPGVLLLPGTRELPEGPQAPPETLAHPPWENVDSDFATGQPLLAGVQTLRPEQRPLTMTGRAYLILEATRTSDDERSDSFVRLGTDVAVDNPFGRGGALHVDAELNQRETEVPGPNDESRRKGRLDRLSYTWGGTRWDDQRRQVGRFLQHAVPELGLLDGAEWSQRLDDGDRWGASVGFIPSDDRDQTTADDLQVAASYTWSLDASERATATAAVQKTWHHGKPDRDLLIAKARVLPADGWALHATTWIDRYTSSDDAKGRGWDLTRARASADRRWDDGDSLRISYLHQEYPELLSDDIGPLTTASLANAHAERLAVQAGRELQGGLSVHSVLGGWVDEDDSGGDVELGLALDDVLALDSRASAVLFLSRGKFSRGAGGRVGYGWAADAGRWDLSYELVQHENDGFDGDFGEILQHWLRVSREIQLAPQWDLSLSLDGRVWEQEHAWSAGAYLQRRF